MQEICSVAERILTSFSRSYFESLINVPHPEFILIAHRHPSDIAILINCPFGIWLSFPFTVCPIGLILMYSPLFF